MTAPIDVNGPVYTPADPGYDAERSGFQTAFRHRPSLLVAALGTADVQAAVRYAERGDLPVAVQATGHGLAVPAGDGAILLSTRRMDDVRIDPSARTAWIGAGARWEQVIKAAGEHGLAPLSGSAPHVGAVGYTLGGGLGTLARRYGYAADHVRRIEVVTADGQVRQASADSHDDLFWALRGGGGNFGVVTGLEIGLVPVDRLYGGGLLFAGEHAAGVLRAYRDWSATVPEELTSSLGMVPVPDAHLVLVRVAYLGDAAEGERLVAPLRAVAPTLSDTLRELPFTESASIYNDPTDPHAYRGDNAFVRELDDAALDAILRHAGPGAPVPCVVDVRHLGGALSRPPEGGNAVGHRRARYLVRVLSGLDETTDGPTADAAHQRLFDALGPLALGRSPGFVYGKTAQASTGFDSATYRRLRELKARHDPRNLFRFNQNIPAR